MLKSDSSVFVENSFLTKFGKMSPKIVFLKKNYQKTKQNESSFDSWISIANPISG